MNSTYVVKIGRSFFIRTENYIGEKRIIVSSDIRKANMFVSIETAIKTSETCGGKVFKVNFELEEVE